MAFKFKEEKNLEERQALSQKILKVHPDRIGVVLEHYKMDNQQIPDPPKTKYLIPKEMTMSHFVNQFRKQIKLSSEDSIFFYTVNSQLIPMNKTILELYNSYKDEDGFLYMNYCGQASFG